MSLRVSAQREELAEVLGVSNPLRDAISRSLDSPPGGGTRGKLRRRLKSRINLTVDQYNEMIRVRMGFLPPQPVQAAVQEMRLLNSLPSRAHRMLYYYTLAQEKHALPSVAETVLGKLGRRVSAVACAVYLAFATAVRAQTAFTLLSARPDHASLAPVYPTRARAPESRSRYQE